MNIRVTDNNNNFVFKTMLDKNNWGNSGKIQNKLQEHGKLQQIGLAVAFSWVGVADEEQNFQNEYSLV